MTKIIIYNQVELKEPIILILILEQGWFGALVTSSYHRVDGWA